MTHSVLPAAALPTQHQQGLTYVGGTGWLAQCPECKLWSTYLGSSDNWQTAQCANCHQKTSFAEYQAAKAEEYRIMAAIYGEPTTNSKPALKPSRPLSKPKVLPATPRQPQPTPDPAPTTYRLTKNGRPVRQW